MWCNHASRSEHTDHERGVAHPQSRVPTLIAVRRGSTPVLGEEQRQVAGRLGQIVGVKRSQERVTRHAEVEPVHQVDEKGLTSDPVVQTRPLR